MVYHRSPNWEVPGSLEWQRHIALENFREQQYNIRQEKAARKAGEDTGRSGAYIETYSSTADCVAVDYGAPVSADNKYVLLKLLFTIVSFGVALLCISIYYFGWGYHYKIIKIIFVGIIGFIAIWIIVNILKVVAAVVDWFVDTVLPKIIFFGIIIALAYAFIGS